MATSREIQAPALSPAGGRRRNNDPCQSCRQARRKCTGERPVCEACNRVGDICVYGADMNIRIEHEDEQEDRIMAMTEKIKGYEDLLRHLSLVTNSAGQNLIQQALAGTTYASNDMASNETNSVQISKEIATAIIHAVNFVLRPENHEALVLDILDRLSSERQLNVLDRWSEEHGGWRKLFDGGKKSRSE